VKRIARAKREPRNRNDSRASVKSGTRSGWRKPAVGYHPIVRAERNHSTKTDRHCRCGFRSHGGLTPAAFVNVRSSTANVAFFGGPASRTKSGWRKPAVGYHPIVPGERNHSTKTDRHCRCDSRTTAG
jgi:hypothetical protein